MPTNLCSYIRVTAAALMAIGIFAGDASAQECLHWGDLDKTLYCDESRDLVADTPSQGYQLQDPDTLVFSYAPVETASIDEKAFAEFMDHISKTTGKKVRWTDAKSSADQIKAMRAGEVHVAGVSPGPTVYAVNLVGYVPIAVMCKDDGTFEYKLQLVTKKASNVSSLADLAGRKVAYVSALSNTGNLAVNGSETVYSGSQENSINGVVKGEYAAAAVNSNDLQRLQKQGVVGAQDLRVIWESPPYPSTSFGFAHNLTPDLQRNVQAAFLTFDWKGTGLAREFGAQADGFCTISYQETWEPIRLMQKENGVTYNVDNL